MTGNQISFENKERRLAIKGGASKLNGIDYLEVYPSNILHSNEENGNDYSNSNNKRFGPNTVLLVYCFKEILQIENLRIQVTGGIEIKDIQIKWIMKADEFIRVHAGKKLIRIIESTQKYDKKKLENVLIVCTDKEGDSSKYTLCFVNAKDETNQPPEFDMFFSKVDFFFKLSYNVDPSQAYLPPVYPDEPLIDYMAKDFASFSGLMLDRLSSIIPDWQERSVADLGIALVELFAYVGDNLSYFQDAVGTESHFATSRRRLSLKRHARLLDFSIREGSNSRVWMQFELDKKIGNDPVMLPDKTILLANFFDPNTTKASSSEQIAILKSQMLIDESELIQALKNGAECFQTVGEVTNLSCERNEIHFYTWHNAKSCLPVGSTHATLRGDNKILRIKPGDILIFEEIDPVSENGKTKESEIIPRANPLHRHAVRVIDVLENKDALFDPPVEILEITWHAEDALPFPLHICEYDTYKNVSDGSNNSSDDEDEIPINSKHKKCLVNTVVRGNVVLAENGHTVYEFLGSTPKEGKFYPSLSLKPLSQRPESIDRHILYSRLSASNTIGFPDTDTIPNVRIFQVATISANASNKMENTILSRDFLTAISMDKDTLYIQEWNLKKDLLDCNEFDRSFVAEIENDGTVFIRFGDDNYGQSPPNSISGLVHLFYAAYQVGNGVNGNVGAETITQILSIEEDSNKSIIVTSSSASSLGQEKQSIRTLHPSDITKITNPLEAQGGCEPQDSKSIGILVSESLQSSQRAVTEDDYIRILKTHPKIEKAMAKIIWTGSWYTVFITIVPNNDQEHIDDKFKSEIEDFLNRYRLAGYDLEINDAKYVPLYLLIKVHIAHNFFQNEIKQQLSEKFGNTNPRVQVKVQQQTNNDTADPIWSGLFSRHNLNFGQTIRRNEIIEIALTVPGVDWVDILQFRRMLNASSDEIENKNNILEMGANEIPKVDNDPDYPENGRIEFILEHGL